MESAEDVLRHLLSSGTCKCGLPCPFHLDNVFNFDPLLESSHSDNTFALLSPLSVGGRKHSCTVMPHVVDEVKPQPPTDTLENQPCGTGGVSNAEGFPLFPTRDDCAPTLSLSALGSGAEAVNTLRSDLVPSEQGGFPSVHAAGDMWQGLQGGPMQQAPAVPQHFPHAVQQILSNPQQPQLWGTPAHPVAAPHHPPALYKAANPPPITYPHQHHQYSVGCDSSMQSAAYCTDLNPLPVAAVQFGSQYSGESQPSSCPTFTPISSHGAPMALPSQYQHSQSHQVYPSGAYPPTTPWVVQQPSASPQSWQHGGVPLKEMASDCAAVFDGVPVQSVVESRCPPQQQGGTPHQVATMAATTAAQHDTILPSMPVGDTQRKSEKVKDAVPHSGVRADEEPVLARNERELTSDAQYKPLHDSPQWDMTEEPVASGELSPPAAHTQSSASSCSSSSSSDSSSSVSSFSDGEEATRGTSGGSHKTVPAPLMVSYPREKVENWLRKEEELFVTSLQPHEELSMAVRIPLSVLPGRTVSEPASPSSYSPLQPDLHPFSSQSQLSGNPFSEELWVKIKLGMTQKQPEVLCDRHIGGFIENQQDKLEMSEKVPSSPPAMRILPSKGKRMARRGNTGEKEGGSGSPDAGFSPLELARMDRTLLGLRPRGKPLIYQQQVEKGDPVTPTDQNRKIRHLGSKESPPHDSLLPPSKKRHAGEDFEAYLPKGVDWSDLSHLSFTDGSLVWAKGKGLPFWPGIVCTAAELEQKPPPLGKVCCVWEDENAV